MKEHVSLQVPAMEEAFAAVVAEKLSLAMGDRVPNELLMICKLLSAPTNLTLHDVFIQKVIFLLMQSCQFGTREFLTAILPPTMRQQKGAFSAGPYRLVVGGRNPL